MEKSFQLPDLLTITGQSGAGKNTAEEIIAEVHPDHVFCVSTGPLISDYSKSNKIFSKAIHTLNVAGKLSPTFFADALVIGQIMNLPWQEKRRLIILNGGPRKMDQLKQLLEWKASGLFNSIHTLHVTANEELCANRLFERTKVDKREDLSVDEQPGVPDWQKIKTKMEWWSSAKDEIIQNLAFHGMYLTVNNDGTIDDLRRQIKMHF